MAQKAKPPSLTVSLQIRSKYLPMSNRTHMAHHQKVVTKLSQGLPNEIKWQRQAVKLWVNPAKYRASLILKHSHLKMMRLYQSHISLFQNLERSGIMVSFWPTTNQRTKSTKLQTKLKRLNWMTKRLRQLWHLHRGVSVKAYMERKKLKSRKNWINRLQISNQRIQNRSQIHLSQQKPQINQCLTLKWLHRNPIKFQRSLR